MIKFVKETSIILVITIFFLEIFGVILSNLKIIPRGSPAVISIFAHNSWSYWHPKNITFKHHYNTCWEPSKITFNNIGSRSTQDIQIEKTKPRIGLLGDSMIEMIHVNDGEDITSLLQQKFPNYEIINFSSRSMGLYDHLDIYRNLIRKYDVDYIFYYPSDNDFVNNFIESNNPKLVFNQPLFYFDETKDKVIKFDRNSEKMEEYFSFYNNFKRSKLILYLKEYSYTFKLYWHTKFLIRNNKFLIRNNRVQKIKFELEEYNEKKKILHKQEKVYRHIMDEFISEIEKDKDDVKLMTILNYRDYVFYGKKNLPFNRKIRLERFNIIKDLWIKYNDAYYNLDEAKNYIESNKDSIIKPFVNLGHTCDSHYSKFGSEFIANITIKYINNYITKKYD